MEPSHTFADAVADILARHRASRHPFFAQLVAASPDRVRSPAFLQAFYLRYQAAMHATRVMVYRMPHLDRPDLRVKKLAIYVDDDGLPGGDTHHFQLARAFGRLGMPPIDEALFGDLDVLAAALDPGTGRFVRTVEEVYGRSLGAWCITEGASDDWLRALASALEVHFPAIREEPYFAECFAQGVEVRHGELSLELTGQVLRERPILFDRTVADAARMAEALDGLWEALGALLEA